MKRIFLPLIFSLLSLLLAGFASSHLQDDSCGAYSGTLGESAGIGTMLQVKDKALDGVGFYSKHLAGNATGEGDLSLQQTDAAGAVKGTFRLHLAEQDRQFRSTEVLPGEVLKGTWTSADGVTYPVLLRMQRECVKPGGREYEVAGAKDDAVVDKNAPAFYNAVRQGKREKTAKYVSYPCTFIRDGKPVPVKNAAEFLKNYGAIFTNAFVAKIAGGVRHYMFANYRGIMIADGAVWFDENGKARNFHNFPAS
jgi:hypothetical protein